MKIKYKYIKKIHLYSCLSTVALLTMYIITSYMMMNHSLVDHELVKEEKTIAISEIPQDENEWALFAKEQNIEGRKTRENTDKSGNQTVEFAHAGGSANIVFSNNKQEAVITFSHKKTGNAIIGIHRQRGYGGGWVYNLYAFLLDIIGISLILFTITGIIMWLKLLKNSRIAWIIFISGFIYVGITMAVLMYW